jgi:hypothetical protein
VTEASYDDFDFQERMDRMKAAVSSQPAAIVLKRRVPSLPTTNPEC